MEDKTKKIIFFIGSLFVAVIFITSYAAFGNNSNDHHLDDHSVLGQHGLSSTARPTGSW